jgi:hypothetical protein
MRIIPAAALFCAVATPALAQSHDTSRAKAQAVVRALQNPMVQEGLAGMVDNLAGIVLDTRVGPLARYADPEVRADDTLRDIQRRRDPGFDKRLHADTRRAVAAAAVLADDALATGAAIEQSTARLRAALAPLRDALQAAGDE